MGRQDKESQLALGKNRLGQCFKSPFTIKSVTVNWHQGYEILCGYLNHKETPFPREKAHCLLTDHYGGKVKRVRAILLRTITLCMSWSLPIPTGSFKTDQENDGDRRERRPQRPN